MKRDVYIAPQTAKFQVIMEQSFMAASEPAKIKEESPVEVEEYERFDNEVTFE